MKESSKIAFEPTVDRSLHCWQSRVCRTLHLRKKYSFVGGYRSSLLSWKKKDNCFECCILNSFITIIRNKIAKPK